MWNKTEGKGGIAVSESEVEKCPKCGGQMVEASRLVTRAFSLKGVILPGVSLAKKRDVLGDRIIPFYCEDCGYIEFYKSPPARYTEETPEFFLKKCVECDEEIPVASEECQYCGTKQPEYDKS